MNHDYSVLTHRILLRPLRKGDLHQVISWRNRDDVRNWFFYSDLLDEKKQINWFEAYEEDESDLCFIIEALDDINEAIGMVALYKVDYIEKTAEFGRLMIGDDRGRGKGFGLETTIGLCKFGISILGLKTIRLEVLASNKRAVSIYEEAGFRIHSKCEKGQGEVYMMSYEG